MHKPQSLFNLTTALHVLGVTITHLQEHKTTASTASGNRYTALLSAAVVEELEKKLHRLISIQPPFCIFRTHAKNSTIFVYQ